MKEKNPSSKNLRNFGNKNTIKSVFPLDLLIISYFILLYPTEYFWIALWCQLKRREYQTTLPVSWEICMQVRKQQLELDMEEQTGSKLRKEYVKAILSPCLFNLYTEYIMRNARLDEAQAGIKIAGRDINNLRYADDTTLIAESEEELKSLLMKVREDS